MKKKFIQHFRAILRIFDREVILQNNASCCNGISVAQCHTLLEIEKNSEISISDLAKTLSLDKSTVSRTVDGLVNINMVNRVIPKENRRLAIIKLKDSGKELCSSINNTYDSYVREIFQDFTDEEAETFLRLFSRLTVNMTAHRGQKKEDVP
ncbi:MAG: MarR family transcriptional regulator [Bacteroidota bacterium]|nr:MarR family transcriptional regulator [Bacteroidota bacterium]